MSTRIVSFLGLGSTHPTAPPPYYKPATYVLDGLARPTTPFTDVATLEAAPEGPITLVVLGTAKVHQRFFGQDAVFETTLRAHSRRDFQLAFEEIPDGSSPAELWQLFNTTTRVFEGGAGQFRTPAGEALSEPEAPAQIWIDMTRGWRAQPIFGAAALSFVRAQERRASGAITPRRVLYAAFQEGAATNPFWDLTPFIEATDWNAALDGLLRFGRADDLDTLLKLKERELRTAEGVDHRSVPRLKQLGDAARDFADGLATARIHAVVTQLAPNLRRAVDQVAAQLAQVAPPVAPQVDRLRAWSERLSAQTLISPEGQRATLELVQLYGQLQRFSEQSALLRERLVDAWTLSRTPADQILQPGEQNNGFNAQRRQHEATLGQAAHARRPGLPSRFGEILQLRNDIQHCGYGEQPASARSLRQRLDKATDTPDLDLAGHPVFLNLSNHPALGWSAPQREAALALGCRSIHDLPFPQVPPDASEADVAALAQEALTAALADNPVAALVAGEPALAVTLVAGLQAAGVRCYVATTRRESVDSPQPDGTVRKTSVFAFERWRAWPALSLAAEPTA